MVYYPETRRCIFPIGTYREDAEKVLRQLSQLGIKTKPAKMSFRLMFHEFYEGKIPKWLQWDGDAEAGVFDFQDSKGRTRLRVSSGGLFLNTYVMTRYYPSDIMTLEPKQILPAVRDSVDLNDDGIDEGLDDHKIIWKGKKERGCIMPDDYRAIAAKWLDEHYPDWSNPMAYWPE